MDERFKRHWDTWHSLIDAGKTPADFLATASDETLVELLAYSAEGTSIERNIIATELTNRISRLHDSVERHGSDVDSFVDENTTALAQAGAADDRIRDANNALRDDSAKTSRYAKGGKHRKGGW